MIETSLTEPRSRGHRTAWLRVTVAVAGVALFVIGIALGAGLNSHHAQIVAQQQQIRTLQQKLMTAHTQADSAQSKMAAAQLAAGAATATAENKAQAQYASREAAVQKLQRQLQHEQGIVQASTISADGVYVVGKDVPAGTYHTSGAPGGGSPGGQCYYATLGSTNTSNILDNNDFNGPETVDLSGAYAFQISGGCTWVKEG
jgi:ribosome-associated translation inhibitor RaiA